MCRAGNETRAGKERLYGGKIHGKIRRPVFDGAEQKREIRTNDRLYEMYEIEDAVHSVRGTITDEGPGGNMTKRREHK